MRPIISIIVPVYNVEVYLRQCLDSILSQTFTAWELILVDDGSPDGSGAICDEYAASDHRIRVFHIPNGGVSNARNVGMKAAKGDWITFIDSDDWVDPDFVEKLYAPIIENPNLDFVHGGIQCINENGISSILTKFENYIGEDFRLLIRNFEGYAVAKLFKHSIIQSNHLVFNTKINLAEDYVFTLEYTKYVKLFCYCSATNYFYRKRAGSATTEKSLYRTIESTLMYVDSCSRMFLEYEKSQKVTTEDTAYRWFCISNMIFYTIRDIGFWKVDKCYSKAISDRIIQNKLLLHQRKMSRVLYMKLFITISKIRNQLFLG